MPVVLLLLAFTTTTVFDDPSDRPVRNVALGVDWFGLERFYVADIWAPYPDEEPRLFIRRWTTTGGFDGRVTISTALTPPTTMSYLASIAHGENKAESWILSNYINASAEQDVQELVVADADGSVTDTQTDVADGLTTQTDVGASCLVYDPVETQLHACWRGTVSNENVAASQRDEAASHTWGTEYGAAVGAGTQDHCEVAAFASNCRAIAYHDAPGGGVEDIRVRVECPTGEATPDYEVNVTSGTSDDFDRPTIAVDTGTNTLHLAAWNKTTDDIHYWKCDADAAALCDADTDWGTAVQVNDVAGSYVNASHPAIAVDDDGGVYLAYQDTEGGDDLVRFAEKCPGGSWTDVDPVDDGDGPEHFASDDGADPFNFGRAYPVILASDASGKVGVTYLRWDTGSNPDSFFGRVAWNDLCP
jgi:hypothetical protein